jgi:Caspase domain
MGFVRLLAALVTLAACGAAAQPRPEARIALVIGNASYPGAPLANPVNDARDMAGTLQSAGFHVILRENASLREMHLAAREFGDRLGRDSVAAFYFAGHGMQVRGRNYLVPVDADIAREDEVAFAAFDLAAVLDKLDSARSRVNLVILDACRNNPFASRFRVSQAGLAQIDAPPGTLIAFSTAPGSVAADGTGRNGLYTRHLLANLSRPGVPIEEAFKAVRAAVRKDSSGAQTPWESTSLEAAFAMVPAPAVALPAGARAAPAPGAPPAFEVGDRWTYRITSSATRSETTFSFAVTEIRGDEIVYDNGNRSDLAGNYTRIRSSKTGVVRTWAPSTQFLRFPLEPGTSWDVRHTEKSTEDVVDSNATIRVIGEEDVDTRGGKFRAVRIERSGHWYSHKDKSVGSSLWTYWYSSAVKRWVLAESKIVLEDGRIYSQTREELVAHEVR